MCLLSLLLSISIHSEIALNEVFHTFIEDDSSDTFLENHLENEFSYEDDQEDYSDSLGICEICQSPISFVETNKGVELQCECD